jgi:hypothetical protein
MVAWSFTEAIPGTSFVAKIAVSSANIAVLVLSNVRSWLVSIRYRTGPKTLPCGTPASVSLKVVISSLNFTWVYPLDMIIMLCSLHGECFSDFEQEAWVKRLCDI